MISARPMTNGGVIIGTIASTPTRRRPGNRVRVTTSANPSARSVAAVAVITPSCSVFHTTPP